MSDLFKGYMVAVLGNKTEEVEFETLYQALKARLLEELLVDVHGTSHYGKLEDHSDTTKGADSE